jgi:hypothetical protein
MPLRPLRDGFRRCWFAGQLIDIDHMESRGKPYTVTFENGETHHCTPVACCARARLSPCVLGFPTLFG